MLNLLKGVLLPFFVACLIAYMLEPIVRWHMRLFKTKSRYIPIILTLIEVIAGIIIFGWLFIPYVVDEVAQMANMLKKYADIDQSIPFLSDNVIQFIRDNIDWNYISRLLTKEEWLNIARNALSSSWSFLNSSLSIIVGMISWAIVILYIIFIMIDYDNLNQMFRQLVPTHHRRKAFRVIDDVKNAMNRYFRGQSLIALSVGIMFSIGFLIIGLPMAVVLGLFIGLLNMVPYLQTISFPITAILCLVYSADTGADFWIVFWQSMAVYLIVQIIQDLLLTPKVMGKAMGLNPAIILLSLSVWGSLLGLMGMIIALPLTTLILSYYDK
jgi:predicted PurR-regulated permease PerM